MTALASSDVTISQLKLYPRGGTKTRRNKVSMVFGNSVLTYPAGGVPAPAFGAFGFTSYMDDLFISDNANGSDILWKWDYTNRKLRAYRQGHIPPLVVEEAVTLTSHVGTLKYPPAYIICTVGTISATVQPLRPIPTGITPATKEVAVTFTTGVVTCFATDAVSAMKVTYIPQQPSGPFSAANLVIDESITLATGTVNTAFRAATMQYCYQTTATAARLPMGHAVASGVVTCDINNAGATTFDCHADNDAKVAKVTYLKYAGFNQPGIEFIDQASIALTSEVKEYGKAAGDRVSGLILPGLGGQIVVFHDTSVYDITYLGDSTVTAASGIVKFDLLKQVITTAETNDGETIEDTPLLFLSEAYTMSRGLAELTVNDAPPATTLYAEAVGW